MLQELLHLFVGRSGQLLLCFARQAGQAGRVDDATGLRSAQQAPGSDVPRVE